MGRMRFLLLTFLWVVACVDEGQDTVEDTSTDGPVPGISLLAPVDGTTVCGSPFSLSVAVENFTLVGFESEEVREGIGHVDIKLNGQNRWMTYYTEFEIPVVVEGLYLAEALLVHEDHHAIEPYTGDSATVTVDDSVCEGR